MCSQIKEPADLRDLEHYLTQRRKEIDRKYDYWPSQLTDVFDFEGANFFGSTLP
jgi:hypothetical protein